MPQFSPSEAKTAIAPITAKPSGMSCEAELFLGPNDATKVVKSGRIPFVSTGAAKNVSLPIVMPSAPGSYHGYVDVFAGGFRFLAYILTEDVVIAAPVALPFTFSNVSAVRVPWSFPSTWRTMNWFCTITNPNDAVVTKTLKFMMIYYKKGIPYAPDEWWRFNLTLNPYQVYTFQWYGNTKGQRDPTAYNGPEMGPGDHICMWLEDLEGNKSDKGCAYY